MSIETEHNGHKITYAENEDVWRCWALDLDAKTLGALRTKINKIDAEARRVDNVNAIKVNEHGFGSHEPVEIVMVDGDSAWVIHRQQRMWRGQMEPKLVREKVKLHQLALDLPETVVAFDRLAEARAAERAATLAAREAVAAIPRVTAAELLARKVPTDAS